MANLPATFRTTAENRGGASRPMPQNSTPYGAAQAAPAASLGRASKPGYICAAHTAALPSARQLAEG